MTHKRHVIRTKDLADGKTEMTIKQFEEFLKQFDENKDDRISVDELRQAIRRSGCWAIFAYWKGNRGMKSADINGDGFIDKDEIPKLAEFAEKELNIKIVAY
ncbi:hypothetical protein OSB04_003240 [Centaurea solstitialis]|uniref:EF-hand domain-containing protein n=1 Tax=Centaurea solstitialis TaxID=347529 RepID=A0AA38WV56_9ASTR|nr:hypothetical protein OSB04_003240 [Centaurea solstitialis]